MRKVAGRTIASLAVVLGLSACVAVVPQPTDSGGAISPNYARDYVRFVIDAGPIPTELHGNPSDLDADRFRDLVLARLRLPPVWGPHRFAVDPQPPPAHRYRLVLVFNPVLDGAHSPAMQPDAGADSAERLELALCAGAIAVHGSGPSPALPSTRLEPLRARKLSPISPKFLAERVLVRGALCLGDVPISSGFVETQALEDYAEPEFDQILSHLLLRLMPYRT